MRKPQSMSLAATETSIYWLLTFFSAAFSASLKQWQFCVFHALRAFFPPLQPAYGVKHRKISLYTAKLLRVRAGEYMHLCAALGSKVISEVP